MPIRYKLYHKKWRLICRLIKKRAGEVRCENEVIAEAICEGEGCGAINRQLHPITGSRVLINVAHLDRDRRKNRFDRLKALCQRCHLRYDQNQRNYSARYGSETQYVNGKLFTE